MSGKQLPVFVHRWFRRGEGWAYHPSLSGKLNEAIYAVDRVLKYGNREGERGKVEFPKENAWIVYAMRLDLNSEDPKAKNRQPFYLTATIIDHNPETKELDKIYQQLENLPEVEEEGANIDLYIPHLI